MHCFCHFEYILCPLQELEEHISFTRSKSLAKNCEDISGSDEVYSNSTSIENFDWFSDESDTSSSETDFEKNNEKLESNEK